MRIHNVLNPATSFVGAGLIAVSLAAATFADENRSSIADVTVGPQYLDVEAHTRFDHAILRISGPEGYAARVQVSNGGQYLTADLLLDAEPAGNINPQLIALGRAAQEQWTDLPDGIYSYEVVFAHQDSSNRSVSGEFRVAGGVAQSLSDADRESQSISEGSLGSITPIAPVRHPGWLERGIGVVLDLLVPSANAQVQAQNITIQNSTPPYLRLEDTSTGITDTWRVQGWNTNLRLQFEPGGGPPRTTPFRIDSGAPDHSIRIISSGNVGINTSAPANRLHVVSTQSRFESESGHAWILNPGFTGFWINEVGGDVGAFQVNKGALFKSLVVASGGVGLGTDDPTARLHLQRSDNTANVRVEDTGAGSPQVMFQLLNNGFPQFNMQDTSQTNMSWSFRLSGNAGTNERFTITKLGTGQAEFELFHDGSANFAGDVTANGVLLTSTREAKTDFRELDERDVLDKLAALEISQWRYKHEDEETVHFGPVAEEFHQIFGLSDGKRLNMIDTNGIAFAAIKALNTENEAIKAESQAIKFENQEIRERLAALERRLLD